jgi:23S rRNA-/tRNA-specific pseudouridylate synthase
MLIDPARLKLPILSQDGHTLVVLKPAGMATELTNDPRGVGMISKIRRAAAEGVRPRLVHRLDRVTRGVMIVALTGDAASFYGEQIREGVWEKYYLARISTPPRTAELIGRHKAHIKEEGTHAKIVRAGGKPSRLEVLAVEPSPGRRGQSHALIRLFSGRLHQIRVMLAALGAPLTGDALYGGGDPADVGPMYLEHVALWYVDCASREIRLAHLAHDPDRERLSAGMERRVREITRRRE